MIITYSVAFLSGLLSFFSPCVFPVMPGYLCLMMSCTPHEYLAAPSRADKRRLWLTCVLTACAFTVGFSAVFIVLGSLGSQLHGFFLDHRYFLTKLGAILIIFFGVITLGLMRLPFLERDVRWHPLRSFFNNRNFLLLGLGACVVGMAFGFGWTPCIGPILGSILVLAAQTESAYSGMILLAFYSLGLGLPLIMMALFFQFFMQYAPLLRRVIPLTRRLAGILLIGLGALLWTDSLQRLTYLVGSSN